MDIFPTAYFGNVAYFQRLVASNNILIEAKEHFVKQTLRTRCEILGPNGVQTLSIPVVKVNGSKTAMDQLLIADDNWQKIHWKSIETAYASAPYFDFYGQEIHELIHSSLTNLMDFNDQITQRIGVWLDVDLELKRTTTFLASENFNNDYRFDSFDVKEPLNFQHYTQVFRSKENCVKNLSILDVLLNEGPLARKWIL